MNIHRLIKTYTIYDHGLISLELVLITATMVYTHGLRICVGIFKGCMHLIMIGGRKGGEGGEKGGGEGGGGRGSLDHTRFT